MTSPSPNIRVCQIVAFALMGGVVMFGGVTLAMRLSNEPPGEVEEAEESDELPEGKQEAMSVLMMVALVFSGVALLGRTIVLGGLDRDLARDLGDENEPPIKLDDCIGRYQTRMIVGMATLEAPAFFALIVFMLEGRWEAFGLAVFFLLVMAINFPSNTKFVEWVETARLNSGTTIGE